MIRLKLELFVGLALLYCLAMFHFAESKLVLLHVLFRHGDRAPDQFLMYPSDPYRNETFFPYGPGQLTNEGKRTMYDLGKVLRHRYDKFLGDLHQPTTLDAWTSDFDRCQSSLQTVLASLYPPKDTAIWREDFHWQPIPYNVQSINSRDMFLGVVADDFIKLYNSYIKTKEGTKVTDKFRPMFGYIQNHTKLDHEITALRELLILHGVLLSEEHYGLELPEWTQKIYPQLLSDAGLAEYCLHMKTAGLRRIVIGEIMKKILDDSENVIKSTTNHQSSTKIHIYSGHDMNLVHALIFLGLMYKHHPGYGACLVLELHQEDDNHFFEVHYRDDKHAKFLLLQFPDGEKRLYLHHFRKMIDQLFIDETSLQRDNLNGARHIRYWELLILMEISLYIYRLFW